MSSKPTAAPEVGAGLARWASDPARGRGRRHPEPPPTPRTEYQRDRDRIVHSTAFRRLVYKTQVFVNHEGDLFRTRLTHSLEVAQIGRSVARLLRLNEDLVEAIALAHDLGHTPFGHAGQDALHACLQAHGSGFEHNLQSLRVVDALEQRYAAFDGLNLSFEAREGVLKRCSRATAERLEAAEPGGVGQRFLDGTQPSLEAQLVNLADEIAYNAHDIDDGVRAGLLTMPQLEGLPLVDRFRTEAQAAHPGLQDQPRRWLAETLRRLLSAEVYDLVAHTADTLARANPADADEARGLGPLVQASPAMRRQATELKRFLFAALYRHPQVMATTERAQAVVRDLFAAYLAAPHELPPEHLDRAQDVDLPRAVADYVAGMTDRFAAREYQRLTGRPAFDTEGF